MPAKKSHATRGGEARKVAAPHRTPKAPPIGAPVRKAATVPHDQAVPLDTGHRVNLSEAFAAFHTSALLNPLEHRTVFTTCLHSTCATLRNELRRLDRLAAAS